MIKYGQKNSSNYHDHIQTRSTLIVLSPPKKNFSGFFQNTMVEEDPQTRLTSWPRLLPEEEEEEEHPHLPAYYTHDGTWNHPAHPRRGSVISLTTGSAHCHSIDVPIKMKQPYSRRQVNIAVGLPLKGAEDDGSPQSGSGSSKETYKPEQLELPATSKNSVDDPSYQEFLTSLT